MAGDWIPIETDLTTQRKVLSMAGRLGVSPFEVVGRLCHFWSWFTSNPVIELKDKDKSGAVVDVYRDGVIDVGAASTEMLDALEEIGWATFGEVDGRPALIVPRYTSWLARCSKARKAKTLRQRKWREGKAKEGEGEISRRLQRRANEAPQRRANVDGSKRGKEKGKSKKENPPISPPRGTAAFDRFWAVVHQKKGIEVARRAFAKAVKRLKAQRPDRDPVAFLVERMTAFAASPEARPTDHSPIHPATWLNQGRYDDDPATWQERKQGSRTMPTAAGQRNKPDNYGEEGSF